jgi:TRAP-type C4-dicarboxylate transport system substrate-binding protein
MAGSECLRSHLLQQLLELTFFHNHGTASQEQQKIVTDAANEVRDELRKNAKAEDMAALEKLKEKGMQVYVVPEAELPAWQSATKPVWDIFVKHTGDLGKELIEICSKQ